MSCSLNISKGQYKTIIEEFKKDGLIEQNGYGDKYKLLYGIYKKKEYGGYCMERDAYMAGLQNLQLQLQKVQKELSQTAISKIRSAAILIKSDAYNDILALIADGLSL